MKLRLLPSSFESDGTASVRQHLTCFLINDRVAIDAGSLAMAVTDKERGAIRDIVLTHAHLDHIAGLPLFVDDQFASLDGPIRIHAFQEVIEVLERDIFNWSVYPRFSELENDNGKVVDYCPIKQGSEFSIGGLTLLPMKVNHKVPCSGFMINDGNATILITGDTAAMDGFWDGVAKQTEISALLIECAFPNELESLAEMAHHLTPRMLGNELRRFDRPNCPIYVINIKPAYRETVVREIKELGLPNVEILVAGREYDW